MKQSRVHKYTLATCLTIFGIVKASHFETLGLLFVLILSFSNQAQAQLACEDLFAPQAQVHTTETNDLNSLGKAMSSGMIVSKDRFDQADIFDIYRQAFLGDPATNLEDRSARDVLVILQAHPELKKPQFTEYNISQAQKVYESPESLIKYLKSQNATSGQVRSNLFQIEANLGYWKKVLDYKELATPLDLTKDQQKEFQKQSKSRFEKYLNRIISKTNRDLLAKLKDDKVDYPDKIKALFKTLKYLQEWSEKKGRNTQALRQAMVDLVHTTGFNNQATLELLRSKNGMDKVEGLKKILDERDSMAMDLGYPGHFQELQLKLGIEFPTGFSKNENPAQTIARLEKEVLAGNYTTKPTETTRVRPLSILEAPFRSCLGGSDCSSRTYFDKALDPNFNYFTMTNSEHQSSGHVTVVLGTAQDQSGKTVKIAFIDKLQNIPTQMIPLFLESVRKSLEDKGYLLGLPDQVGDHNGISNMDNIRNYMQTEIIPRFQSKLKAFTPHNHDYHFENEYSRAYSNPTLRIVTERSFSDAEIQRGQTHQTKEAPVELKKEQLIQDFLRLKDSLIEEDQLKFIKSGRLVSSLQDMGLYRQKDFEIQLRSFMDNPKSSLAIKKNAFFELIIRDIENLERFESKFSTTEFQQINAELKQWKNSNDQRKKNAVQAFNSTIFRDMFEGVFTLKESMMKSGLFDINAQDNSGNTILMAASHYDVPEFVATILKIPGIDVNFQNHLDKEQTAFHEALSAGNVNIAELIMRAPGFAVNLANKSRQTPLAMAILVGDKSLVQQLLNIPGIHVNADAVNGGSNLQFAISMGRKDLVELLVNAPGININYRDKRGDTALSYALAKHKLEIADLIRAHGGRE